LQNTFRPINRDAVRGLTLLNRIYDPDGLFFVHHEVGSERWSDDGFMRLD
jgi:hypothetical protein